MLDTINFIDLIALSRITPESTVERFGGTINSSFFDASNILGTLKQKGLVDFVTSFPSQSALTVTEQGKQLLDEATDKAKTPFDTLDMAVIVQISNGKRYLQDISSGVNVTPKDLAMHLFKLSEQKYMSYELRNGNINMALTEKGFLAVKEGGNTRMMQTGPMPQQQTQQQAQQSPNVQAMDNAAVTKTSTPQDNIPKNEEELKALETKIMAAKKNKAMMMYIAGIVIVLIVIFAYLYLAHLI